MDTADIEPRHVVIVLSHYAYNTVEAAKKTVRGHGVKWSNLDAGNGMRESYTFVGCTGLPQTWPDDWYVGTQNREWSASNGWGTTRIDAPPTPTPSAPPSTTPPESR